MNKYVLAGFIINDAMDILEFRGWTGPYLEPAPGEASFNILKIVRGDLRLDLRALIHKAQTEEGLVKKEGGRFSYQGHFLDVRLEAIPMRIPVSAERYFLVLFEDVTRPAPPESKQAAPGEPDLGAAPLTANERLVVPLKDELATTKRYLQEGRVMS